MVFTELWSWARDNAIHRTMVLDRDNGIYRTMVLCQGQWYSQNYGPGPGTMVFTELWSWARDNGIHRTMVMGQG